MAYEKQDDTGFLFRNEKKTSEKQPDYTGWIKENGKERRLAAWVKDMRDGSKALSIKISDKQEGQNRPQNKAPDHDIPF